MLTRIAAVAVTGTSLLAVPAAAHADEESVLYVRKLSAACSDAEGAGSLERPFCTVGAAAAVVSAGQTVDIGPNVYRERVTLTASGTAEKPITFRGSGGYLAGSTSGFVVDGLQHIRFERIGVTRADTEPGFDLRNSSHIELVATNVSQEEPTVPAIRLTGVADSLLKDIRVSGSRVVAGVVMDSATSGVTVDGAEIDSVHASVDPVAPGGIRIEGPGNTVVNSTLTRVQGVGVWIGPGAAGTVVANNEIERSRGHGIHNAGATGTAITNNTLVDTCHDGIRVDGSSAGVSVQNNLVTLDSGVPTGCSQWRMVWVGLYDDAVRDTVVDYNQVSLRGGSSWKNYVRGDTRMSLAEFRAASGQAAHDVESDSVRPIDSANSAAPGYQATDKDGRARVDDIGYANTGAGPVTYADRGATEMIRTPVPRLDATLDLTALSVDVDAAKSLPGSAPIDRYEFDFGDGTVVTQPTTTASHRYEVAGSYTVGVKVFDTSGRSADTTQSITVKTPMRSIGLLSAYKQEYVGAKSPALELDGSSLEPAGQFDLVDAGNGRVAIFSRAAGKYVTNGAGEFLRPDQVTATGDEALFTLVRNSDGSVSLLSARNGRYVGLESVETPYLIANRTTVGSWEKFYQVKVGESARSVKAKANDRFVTAEGVKPLIANRTAVGGWERFDIVDLGDSQVALLSHANRMFVTAEDGGAKPLTASRASIGGWEKFTVVRHADETVSFKAAANGRYVTAEDGGAKPLIASRTSVGSWEKFTLG